MTRVSSASKLPNITALARYKLQSTTSMGDLPPKYATPFEQVHNFRDVGATVNAHCLRPYAAPVAECEQFQLADVQIRVLKERLFYRSSRLGEFVLSFSPPRRLFIDNGQTMQPSKTGRNSWRNTK
jgi:hypothetical protein